MRIIKKGVKFAYRLIKTMRFSPKAILQFIWINFLRKNTTCNVFKGNIIVPTPYCVFDVHSSVKIITKGFITIGFSKVRGSHLETRIRLEKKTNLIFNDIFTLYAGADIQVFEGGALTFEGGESSGCNIYCQIICADSIRIGKGTLIGRNVILRDYDAHYILQDNYKVKSPINIGDHCWIGESALISKGVSIGDGSVVASRSWVIRNVKPRTLVGGSPAIPLNNDIEWRV